MKSNSQILYERLKEIDLSVFQINLKDNLEISPNIKKNMRYIGTEFERVFTTVLSEKYGLISDSSRININEKINSTIKFERHPSVEKNNLFKLEEFLENFKYFSKHNNLLSHQKESEIFIRELLTKTNYGKFKPKKHILTKIKFQTRFGNFGVDGLYSEIDLIVDDKIIDIKTDTELKLNKDYIVQLLYYYFLLNYSFNSCQDSKSYLKKLKINKICLYYACFDILVEFDLNKIFKNSSLIKKIDLLINNSFIGYNFNLKELIRSVVYNKKLNAEYFEAIETKINENQLNIFKAYIKKKLNVQIENIYIKQELLLQIIKINLALFEFKKTNPIPKENDLLIISLLINTFRKSFKINSINKFRKLNNKHLFMDMSDYSQIITLMNRMYHYDNFLKEKNIQKHIKEIYIQNRNNCYDCLINIENDNKEDFKIFIKNINSVYLEFYNQKINKIITPVEFGLIQDTIIELVEYEIKTNKEYDSCAHKLLIKYLKNNKSLQKKGLISNLDLQKVKHTILCKF